MAISPSCFRVSLPTEEIRETSLYETQEALTLPSLMEAQGACIGMQMEETIQIAVLPLTTYL